MKLRNRLRRSTCRKVRLSRMRSSCARAPAPLSWLAEAEKARIATTLILAFGRSFFIGASSAREVELDGQAVGIAHEVLHRAVTRDDRLAERQPHLDQRAPGGVEIVRLER